jgi:hypothetical protein
MNRHYRSTMRGATSRRTRMTGFARTVMLTLLLIASVLTLAVPVPVLAGGILPPLGTAASFGVLAGSAVTNTGPTTVRGNVGVSPGTAVTGFPPGIVIGTIHAGDSVAAQAQNDATIAYNNAAGQPCDVNLTGQDLGGMTLTPGVYCFDSSAQLTGQLTLDGQGNPDSVFIFQVGSTLITASNAQVLTINGAQPCRIFWQVGSSATLGTNTRFQGNILALTSITLNTGATTSTGLYALNGAITLDTNDIQACGFAGGGTSTPTVATTATNTATAIATATSSATTVVATATSTPGATNTPIPGATNTPAPVGTNTPVNTPTNIPTIPTTTPVPRPTDAPTQTPGVINTLTPISTSTLPPGSTVVPTNTAVATGTVVPSTTASATGIAIGTPSGTAIATAIQTTTSTSTATMPTTVAIGTPTSTPISTGAVPGGTPVGGTPVATQTISAPAPSPLLPPTGGGLSWLGPFILLLSALLLLAGLGVRRLLRM